MKWLDATGKVTTLLSKPGNYGTPRFSPDGKQLAFTLFGTKGADVWIYDLERDTPTQLTFTGPGQFEMAWAPDGKHIAFGSASGNTTGLWWVRSDGSGEPQRLLEGRTLMRPQSFSPDGKHLAFDETISGQVDIFTLPLDISDPDHPKPGKPEPFLNTPFVEVDSAFSPDGRWIAYESAESGRGEIFVRPFPGPGGKWKISTEGGKFPTWSRSGRELFYLGEDDRIMVAGYATQGDSFVPGKPRLWCETPIVRTGFFRPFDLAPDGKRFAVFPRPEAEDGKGSLHVTFLLNFIDELRRRIPETK
jgi:serine/threonine-protein kinase